MLHSKFGWNELQMAVLVALFFTVLHAYMTWKTPCRKSSRSACMQCRVRMSAAQCQYKPDIHKDLVWHMQMITTMYNNIHSEADKDNAKWGINDISRGYT